jgi:hypothetical protein
MTEFDFYTYPKSEKLNVPVIYSECLVVEVSNF